MLEGNEAWSDEKTLDLARVLTTSICALHTSGLFHGNLDKESSVKWCRGSGDEKERMCVVDYKLSSVLIRESNPLEFAKQCEDDAKRIGEFIYSARMGRQRWQHDTSSKIISAETRLEKLPSDTDKRIRQIVKETFCSSNNNSTFVEDEKEEDEGEFYIRERKEALGKELRHRYEASLPIEMRKDFKSIQSAYVVFEREVREYHLYHSQLFI